MVSLVLLTITLFAAALAHLVLLGKTSSTKDRA